jgi:hypothetical protein
LVYGKEENLARKKIETEEPQEELSVEQVFDVLTFARELGLNASWLTPMLINQRLKDITMNPVQATEDALTQAMMNPKESEIALQEFSQDFENQSQVYKKLLSYLGNMLSFDLTYECINAKPEDYKSTAYTKDIDIFKKFLDGFDYKKNFNVAVNEMLRNEAYFFSPRWDGDYLIMQELPASPQWTMITGNWRNGFLFDFNMYWFIQPGVDLKGYSRFFMEKYKTLWDDGTLQKYIPSLSATTRGTSGWVYWQQVPVDEGWVFKFNPYSATRIPYFSGLFLDLVQQPLIRALQKNINMTVASRLIMGQVAMLKDTQSKTRDQFTMTAETLGRFLGLVKASIGESLKVAAAPLENMQAVAFKSENEVYSSFLKTALATSGVNTNLIFTSDVRPNAIESQLSLNVDEQMMYALYPQFESFMNYQINKLTKKYKFKVHFEGTQFYNNRQLRLDNQMTLASQGIVMPNKISAAIGMNPFEFQRNLDEAKANGWVDKLTPIVSGFQQSADGAKGSSAGRPQKKDSELSQSGEETRSSGGNIEKGGKK